MPAEYKGTTRCSFAMGIVQDNVDDVLAYAMERIAASHGCVKWKLNDDVEGFYT
jgi:hypothetical protein